METESVVKNTRQRSTMLVYLALIGFALLIFSLSIAISVGAVAVPTGTVWGVLANKVVPGTIDPYWSKGREAIIWDIRFPRGILSMMVGAGLAIVGASLQAVTRNPLADPHLLGISSGGAFGAILALLHTGLFLGLLTVGSISSFFGCFRCDINSVGSITFCWRYEC